MEAAVYQAMGEPLVGYLDPYFFEVTDDVRRMLQMAFGTKNSLTLAISGTGSSGMETAVTNFVDPGSKLLVFSAGFFADRLAEMGKRHRAEVVKIDKAWGETFSEAEARAAIEREKPAVVAFVHAETSTGALQNPLAITGAAHDVGALTIADCVTSLGAVPMAVDASGIDVAYSCSQKGLSCPPGLSPFTASARAVAKMDARTFANEVWYLDLKLLRDYYDPPHKYHHTAPISTFYALRAGLRCIEEEGFEARWKRHADIHQQFVAGMEGLGLQMHVAAGQRIPHLNTVRVAPGMDDANVRSKLMQDYGIEIAGGFGPLAGKIFRIGVMGPLATAENLEMFLKAFRSSM